MRAVVLAAFAAGAVAHKHKALRAKMDIFNDFLATYGRTYTAEERVLRSAIFDYNVAKINAHNAEAAEGKHTWTMGVNKFSDLTADEWRAKVSSGKRNKLPTSQAAPPVPNNVLPDSVNWTAQGKVTPVKDQGQCGSCWAFATVLAIEGDLAVNKGQLVSLSEQQFVSCETNMDGCDGGDQLPALQWISKQGGLCTEAAYPYTSGRGSDGTCAHSCTPFLKISTGVEVPLENETALMAAIAMQPISLSVDASNDNVWQHYKAGVVTGVCNGENGRPCTNARCLDHGVGGIGYGTDAVGGDYWLVKNSWGTTWGERGYIRLARGAAYNPYGQCGLQIDNQYSVGATPL